MALWRDFFRVSLFHCSFMIYDRTAQYIRLNLQKIIPYKIIVEFTVQSQYEYGPLRVRGE